MTTEAIKVSEHETHFTDDQGQHTRCLQFHHSTVMLKIGKDCNGRTRTRLYIQSFDSYRRQHELTIEYRHEPGNMDNMYWELHAYRHPGVRKIHTLTEGVARRMIARIIELCENYPTLLFNEATTERPGMNEGFIMFNEALLSGYTPSVTLLR